MRFATAVSLVAAFAIISIAMVKDHPATAAYQPQVVLTHFECYQPVRPGPPPPAPRNLVQLSDQFQKVQVKIGQSQLFCTPVVKTLQQGVQPLPVPAPVDHLTCYQIDAQPINHTLVAMNQLQRPQLQVGKPTLLCVPTHKKLLQ